MKSNKNTEVIPSTILMPFNSAAQQLKIPARTLRSLHRRGIRFEFVAVGAEVMVQITRDRRSPIPDPIPIDSMTATVEVCEPEPTPIHNRVVYPPRVAASIVPRHSGAAALLFGDSAL